MKTQTDGRGEPLPLFTMGFPSEMHSKVLSEWTEIPKKGKIIQSVEDGNEITIRNETTLETYTFTLNADQSGALSSSATHIKTTKKTRMWKKK